MAMNTQPERFVVEDVETGDRFGNHTYSQACSRAAAMTRNWLYKKKFVVRPINQDEWN
jgi:hypothetical protein